MTQRFATSWTTRSSNMHVYTSLLFRCVPKALEGTWVIKSLSTSVRLCVRCHNIYIKNRFGCFLMLVVAMEVPIAQLSLSIT